MRVKINILGALMLSCLFTAGDASAIDLFGLPALATTNISVHGECKIVKNNTSKEFFIPVKTLQEWSLFKSHLPTGVALNECTGTKDVSVGGSTTCAVTLAGKLQCWGKDYRGPSYYYGQNDVPLEFKTGIESVDVGLLSVCAINNIGKLRCWGHSGYGQLNIPAGFTSGAKAVAVGSTYNCAITRIGQVKCWGQSAVGGMNVPSGLEVGARGIAVGGGSGCAINNIGAVKCWGSNNAGIQNIPAGLEYGAQKISGEDDVMCVINRDGKVICWGRVENGGYNPGGIMNSGARDISVGVTWFGSACGIDKENNIGCWTGPTWGGHFTPGFLPNSYKQIDNSAAHRCAIDTQNKLWCVGSNSGGQLNIPAGY